MEKPKNYLYRTLSGYPVDEDTAKELFKICPTFAYNPEVLKQALREQALCQKNHQK